jgi:hypothetical protein
MWFSLGGLSDAGRNLLLRESLPSHPGLGNLPDEEIKNRLAMDRPKRKTSGRNT